MPLVEVVSGLATSPEVAATIFATAAAWGKAPVHAASTPGFIVNRCARPFYGEGLRLLAEGAADVATLDAVLREAGGFRMGPFELMDLIGLDVNFAVTKSVWEGFFHDPRYAPSVRQQELVAAGWLGRKTGRGFYDYAPQAAKPAPRERASAAGAGEAHRSWRPRRRVAAGRAHRARPASPSSATRADSRFPAGALHIPGKAGGAWLALTDGRTATSRAVATGVRDLVLFDLAHDYATASRLAVARADSCSDAAWQSAIGRAVGRGHRGQPARRRRRTRRHAHRRGARERGGRRRRAAGRRARRDRSRDAERASTTRAGRSRGAMRSARRRCATCSRNLAAHYGEDRYRISPLVARRAPTGGALGG